MLQTPLNDKLIITLTEKIESSDKKDKINLYIKEVSERCANLCEKGEGARALNEFKILFDTLRKEFDL